MESRRSHTDEDLVQPQALDASVANERGQPGAEELAGVAEGRQVLAVAEDEVGADGDGLGDGHELADASRPRSVVAGGHDALLAHAQGAPPQPRLPRLQHLCVEAVVVLGGFGERGAGRSWLPNRGQARVGGRASIVPGVPTGGSRPSYEVKNDALEVGSWPHTGRWSGQDGRLHGGSCSKYVPSMSQGAAAVAAVVVVVVVEDLYKASSLVLSGA